MSNVNIEDSINQSKPKDSRMLYEQILETLDAYPSRPFVFLHAIQVLLQTCFKPLKKNNLSLAYPWLLPKASNTPKQIVEELHSNTAGSFLKKSEEIFTVDRHTVAHTLSEEKVV